MSGFKEYSDIVDRLKNIPTFWDGKKSILEMKKIILINGSKWNGLDFIFNIYVE